MTERRVGIWSTIKMALMSAFLTCIIWVGWDHAQALVWRGGAAPAVREHEFWFTPFILYLLVQAPAVASCALVRPLLSHFGYADLRFVAYPVLSIVTLLSAGYLVGVNLTVPHPVWWIVAIVKTSLYGLVFATLDKRAPRKITA